MVTTLCIMGEYVSIIFYSTDEWHWLVYFMINSDERTEKNHFSSWDDLQSFEQINIPVWIFDVTTHKIWWGNKSAIHFWKAATIDDLVARDFSNDSETVRQRLRQSIQETPPGGHTSEVWTLYPHGNPVTVNLTMTPVTVKNGEDAVLIQASAQIDMQSDPQALRLLEATRYTSLMVASFTREGKTLVQNPADLQNYGQAKTGTQVQEQTSDLEKRFMHSDDYMSVLKSIAEGKDFVDDFEMCFLQGARWCQVALRHGQDPMTGGKIIIVTQEDIHTRVKSIAQLTELNTHLDELVEKRTNELNQALIESHLANHAKSAFLANMSHDLRTPLNAIIGFSDFILNEVHGKLTPTSYNSYVKDIFNSGHYLLDLITDILDLSKISAGEMALNEENVDIQSILLSAYDLQKQSVEDKNLTFTFDASNLYPDIYVDKLRLSQIINNIFSNAVKFTKQDGAINVNVFKDEAMDLVIQIQDSGIGIPQEDVDTIFAPFNQVKKHAFSHNGTGLGLSIVKSFIELHDGMVSLNSKLNRGTTVTITLPAVRIL